MDGVPWVSLPLRSQETTTLSKLVPCTGYPTPGIICGDTGKLIDADVFGKVTYNSINEWLTKK
jgi:hypothetical protein